MLFSLLQKINNQIHPECFFEKKMYRGTLKNTTQGFSIIEIVISIVIISTTLMALFGSQAGSIRSVARGHQTVIRLYTIKNQITKQGMQPVSDEPAKVIEGQIPKPKTSLKYWVKNIPFESALAPLKNIYLIQASGKWRTLGKEFKELFVGVLFVPKKPKK